MSMNHKNIPHDAGTLYVYIFHHIYIYCICSYICQYIYICFMHHTIKLLCEICESKYQIKLEAYLGFPKP